MPYTLVKFLLWALLLAVVGGVIGWLLRSLTCRAEMAGLRAIGGDQHELERLRARSAELDDVTAERDRLRMEVADVRGSSAGTLGFATTVDPAALAAASAIKTSTTAAPMIEPSDSAEPIVEPIVEPAPDVEASAGLATLIPAHTSDSDEGAEALGSEADDEGDTPPEALDLDAARTVIGRSIKLDDLTVVEGIGPKIAELAAALGIDTWRALADTDVATLRSMLDDAGARFKMHRPDSWPEQAGMLADGRWHDFTALTNRLDGGA